MPLLRFLIILLLGFGPAAAQAVDCAMPAWAAQQAAHDGEHGGHGQGVHLSVERCFDLQASVAEAKVPRKNDGSGPAPAGHATLVPTGFCASAGAPRHVAGAPPDVAPSPPVLVRLAALSRWLI